jgi:hypothetical protein
MVKKIDYLTSISDLLPEGLDEVTLDKVAALLASKIDEEVKAQIGDLTNKVTSFIRGNVEKLKEHAVKELELENETFRNAQLFETVRSMFAVENTAEDELNGINALAGISEAQEQKITVLATELDKLVKENVRLRKAGKLLSEQNVALKESVAKINETVSNATAKNRPHMSDSAIVVSEETFKKKEAAKDTNTKKSQSNGNEWLNESVLDAHRKLGK